jgi:hypothetical protein
MQCVQEVFIKIHPPERMNMESFLQFPKVFHFLTRKHPTPPVGLRDLHSKKKIEGGSLATEGQ